MRVRLGLLAPVVRMPLTPVDPRPQRWVCIVSAESVSQQITRLIGTDDWVILHSGHTLLTNEELEEIELADDVRASIAGDTLWDRQCGVSDTAPHEHVCTLGHPHPIVKCRCLSCGDWFELPESTDSEPGR